ncbi:MAG: aldehyde ferredoxin oxidoreductase family protein [Thermoplasmata archaeon]
MKGFTGRILRVDLSSGLWRAEPTDPVEARAFLGGKGYAASRLFRELAPGTEPLSPENKVALMAGPLTGTSGPMANRFAVCTKSPLTGAWLDSHCGGRWGVELKRAGWDGIILEGRAEGPVHMRIRDADVELAGASDFWGKGTFETTRAIQEGEIEGSGGRRPSVLCIGPAGESLCLTACVIADARAAGRGGAGAVLGSKNLKAISVLGTGSVPLADEAAFEELARRTREKLLASPSLRERHILGTAGNVRPVNATGGLPTRNFQKGSFEAFEEITGDAFSKHLWNNSKNLRPCWGCVIPCAHYAVLRPGGPARYLGRPGAGDEKRCADGKEGVAEGGAQQAGQSGEEWWGREGRGVVSGAQARSEPGAREDGEKWALGERSTEIVDEGPEYETIAMLGSNLGIADREAIALADYMLDDVGLDTISFGNTLGFLIECFETGLLGLEETSGLRLEFGCAEVLHRSILIASKRAGPLGGLLADGVLRASRRIGKGSEGFAMHVKGLEIPAYDPRASPGQALAYAVADRGACHLRPFMYGSEHFGKSPRLDALTYEGKAAEVKSGQERCAVVDSIGLCLFHMMALSLTKDILPLLNAATGFNYSEQELLKVGERINNLTRAFNCREGFDVKDDALPPRCREPLRDGKRAGLPMELERMLPEYYRLCGWDERGVPTPEKLGELGLEFAIDSLTGRGR